MIAGIFHEGSGLGNQLFRYITVRILAEEKGLKWGMVGNGDSSGETHIFKGRSFLKDIGCGDNGSVAWMMEPDYKIWNEKKVIENGVDIRSYDPEINFVSDNTIIDGEFQDERYWGHKLPEIDKWLKVETIRPPDHLCMIGFRGGEYVGIPDLFLTKEYWDTAIAKMREINPRMIFEVHTDDPYTASQFFPDFPIVDNQRVSHSNHTNMGLNWRTARYAKYAIIANSSFFILPRLLSGGVTIAPRYWARRNTGVWALPQNYYKQFTYV